MYKNSLNGYHCPLLIGHSAYPNLAGYFEAKRLVVVACIVYVFLAKNAIIVLMVPFVEIIQEICWS